MIASIVCRADLAYMHMHSLCTSLRDVLYSTVPAELAGPCELCF